MARRDVYGAYVKTGGSSEYDVEETHCRMEFGFRLLRDVFVFVERWDGRGR